MENIQSQLNPEALNIAKAIAYTENGGAPNIDNLKVGATGETKSIFQFTPDTWKQYAKQVFGDSNAPLTPKNESLVTYQKVNTWLNEGYKPEEIASMWNAGEQRPEAYKQNFKGVNKKYGVQYDTPKYVQKFSSYLKNIQGKASIGNPETKNSLIQGNKLASNGMIDSRSQTTNPGILTPVMKQARQV